jgi:uncharacterized protein YjbI with pentapeptide repeats
MPDTTHAAVLKHGVSYWNAWRKQNPGTRPDLSGIRLWKADLAGVDLQGAQLARAELQHANLREALLSGADLRRADLSNTTMQGSDFRKARLYRAGLNDANLESADLREADLCRAGLGGCRLNGTNLRGAILEHADLGGADLTDADLTGANLMGASLVGTNLTGARLTNCRLFGISVWGVNLAGAEQSNLVITPEDEPRIEVDNIEVAQFIYLLLNNDRIRHVIDTITSKVVLILGRFTPARKTVLDGLRSQLRLHDYLPVLFDFQKPRNQSTMETITTLAHLARFVIADLTDSKSILQELHAIVPNRPCLPVQCILELSQKEPGMFDFFKMYPWVLPVVHYEETGILNDDLLLRIVESAELSVRTQSKIL